jgi:hypothetical protein
MGIHNTSADMRDPANLLGLLLEGMSTGSPTGFIERQEAAGQRQLVNSDRLPTNKGDRAEYEALGFTFGDPDPSDMMFSPATLPTGWRREGSDHAMWSHILDGLGRRRVSIFYKAAFYDRSAHMSLNTVYGYVQSCIWDKAEVVTDETWATRQAVAAALRDYIAGRNEAAALYAGRDGEHYATRRQEIAAEIAAAEAYLAKTGSPTAEGA